jgi:predicted CXXCH cytochrome family protein
MIVLPSNDRRMLPALLLMLATSLGLCAPAHAQSGVRNTKHNLTPSGPGTVKESVPTGLCVFCHAPHNASPTRALWNRQLSGVTYQLYTSTTLKAALNQPTGTSRLCLSCHDGTIALGSLRVPPPGAPLTLGLLTGETVLGTDIRDDHPISFTYDSALAVTRGQLADPSSLPPAIHLNNGQLECTSCHDPHTDRQAKFLRMNNRYGALCTACHQPTYWNASSHAASSATWNGSGTDPWPAGAYPTVTENACLSCHRPHAAGHAARLLAQSVEPTECTVCHNGAVAAKNIEAEFQTKPYYHPIQTAQWTHLPDENPLSMQRHVACVDCHNPHAVNATPGVPPAVPGRLKGVKGVSLSGSVVAESSFMYEVCLKCHGLAEPTTTGIVRQYSSRNIRLKINSANPSYHPIAATGKNTTMVSQGFEAGYDTSTIITCTSCHNNDDWTPAGTAPLGPHGSRNEPILERQQATNDPTTESAAVYAMCYKCHNRSAVINDVVHFNKHNRHVVSVGAPCSVCHDAHGSAQNPHLINFMLRDRTGKTVVQANTSGVLQYTSTGVGSGSCSLRCHNRNHSGATYP